MLLLISTMKLLYISDEEPQNNRNHPGKISYQCDADLLFFFKRNNHVFFSPTFFCICTSLCDPFSPFYLYVHFYHLPIHPQTSSLLPVFQSAKWGFTARCWSLWPVVNVHLTVWPDRWEPLLAAVKTDTLS